uniref:Uncharacterized protein n=1 Tax=Hyaloperonospora arabidopsidis (strain Emoy2) TaxID=559515 RepID=M4BSU7_HYAAE
MPAVTAKTIRDRSRSTIQRLLLSYIRRKQGIPSVPSKAAPYAVPPGARQQDSAPPDIRPTGSPGIETLGSHDLDVTMAYSTSTFGNTMRMDDLGGGDFTPSPCAASVPLPAEISQAIKDDLKASSGNIAGDTPYWRVRESRNSAGDSIFDGSQPPSRSSRSDFTCNAGAQGSRLRVGCTGGCSCDGEHQSTCCERSGDS